MKIELLLSLMCSALCHGMMITVPSQNQTQVAIVRSATCIDLMSLLTQKKFDEALALPISPSELAKATDCLSSAITNGASSDWIRKFRNRHPVTRQHFIQGIDMATRIGSVDHYEAIWSNALNFEGIESDEVTEACLIGAIDAAAGNFTELLAAIIENYSPNKATSRSIRATPQDPHSKTWLTSSSVNGKTDYRLPLHAAVDWDRLDTALLLLLHKADPELSDHKGDTPLSIAKGKDLKTMERLLSLFRGLAPSESKLVDSPTIMKKLKEDLKFSAALERIKPYLN